MDHAEAIDTIETAATEPGGLDRLMAGDTPEAARLAGHLAACSTCASELLRIRRTSELAREAVASGPDPELRARTLAYVRAVGRPRAPQAPPISAASGTVPTAPVRKLPLRRILRTPAGWAASVAATAVLAVALTAAVLQPADTGSRTEAALAEVATATLRLEALPDARRVELVGTGGSATAGTLLFSPSTGELIVVAPDLAEPPAGSEYRCWVETEDGRRRMGRMFFGGGIAYWVGPVDGLSAVDDGTRFGVSLVPLASDGPGTEEVLVGEL
ncbi:MAG TPA: anti-sigma factor [Candidatus Limnocylindrales bacterium]|nr:anti-sigma factor [Candidatus Limnocylindrales bacterium]